jgi:hypothetical protein
MRLSYYNSAILSRLLDKYQTGKNSKAFVLLNPIKSLLPAWLAWNAGVLQRTAGRDSDYRAHSKSRLDTVAARMSGCRCIHLFYAGPVSLAFHLGQQISENIHPPVIVWNYRREEGYNWAIALLRASRGEASIRRPRDAAT